MFTCSLPALSLPSDYQHGPPGVGPIKKKKKLADKILPQKVRDLVPESQAYMDLLAFERKLDSTIMRKRLDIQVSSMVRFLKNNLGLQKSQVI